MPIPVDDHTTGTKPPTRDHGKVHGGDSGNGASQPKGGTHRKAGKVTPFDIEALNPPFDPRMRRIGNPDNLTSKIKRGWIQNEQTSGEPNQRVNFLFNPPAIGVTHAITTSVPTDLQKENEASAADDTMTPSLASTGNSVSLQLLYDRTYEVFSSTPHLNTSLASNYGVWADVAAWYTFLGAFKEMPGDWTDGTMDSPPVQKMAYLFMGPKMYYYGFVSSLGVTYSHWNLNMVPVRCAVDISFEIYPNTGKPVWRGKAGTELSLPDWLGGNNFQINPGGSVTGGDGSLVPGFDPTFDLFEDDPLPDHPYTGPSNRFD